ncbi:hypothetical protein JKF63_05325 [Porcisia hertigi]|uniref:Uncharacterized protein n=1 Tax=Porcisia hertigi TaxID=2761500 RepID=A0A836LIS7_9TRYP|nr:hypothetical protein JKF63_05325 [Porcisia hertigi]
MLCFSSLPSQGSQSRAASDTTSRPQPSSKLDACEGGEATFIRDLKTSDPTGVLRETPRSGHHNTTAGNTDTAFPAGSGFFACSSRSFLCRGSPATKAAPAVAAPSSVAATQRLTAPQNYGQLMCELIVWESKCRQQLIRYEQEELAQMVWSVEERLSPVMATLRDVNALDVLQNEKVRRWSIQNDYCRFLLDLTQLQEVLHRRSLSFVMEPQCRRRIENVEVSDWIETRRLDMRREAAEYTAEKRKDRDRRLAYSEFIQQQHYQIFLMEQSEQAGRMEVERQQRLYAGCILEEMARGYRHARLCQLKYEAMRHELRPEVARNLAADEARHRTWLYQEQAVCFKKTQAEEIRSYLASSRQELLNTRVEES